MVALFPRQADSWRWWLAGASIGLFALYLVLVGMSRAATADHEAEVNGQLRAALDSLARLEERRDLAPAAVFSRARQIRNALFTMEHAAKAADAAAWRAIQEDWWALRKPFLECLDDLSKYDVADRLLWEMRPELPLTDRARLTNLSDKFDELVETFGRQERPDA
jgi:hypothetical protein